MVRTTVKVSVAHHHLTTSPPHHPTTPSVKFRRALFGLSSHPSIKILVDSLVSQNTTPCREVVPSNHTIKKSPIPEHGELHVVTRSGTWLRFQHHPTTPPPHRRNSISPHLQRELIEGCGPYLLPIYSLLNHYLIPT